MKVMVVLAHPATGSFNHAIARTASNVLEAGGYEVVYHDLYAERFDSIFCEEELRPGAVLPELVQRHCRELGEVDGLIVVHPNWWGQPPAIMKGWIDRVFRVDVAYRFLQGDKGEGVPMGLLKALTALVFNTSNTAKARELAVFGDPLERLWKACLLEFCGVRHVERRMFETVITSDEAQRRQWLVEVAEMVRSVFPAAGALRDK